MIIHTVLMKLKKEADETLKKEYIENIKNNVTEMKNNISAISELELGAYDDTVPFASYDLILNIRFKDADSYKTYMCHPLHAKAHDYATLVSESLAGITYSNFLV